MVLLELLSQPEGEDRPWQTWEGVAKIPLNVEKTRAYPMISFFIEKFPITVPINVL